MIRLHLFGPPRLQGVAGEPLAAQPKRTALLAYLAVARPRGVQRRDTLLGMLWPDLDAPRARSALSQALYSLRRALGSDVLENQGENVIALVPGKLTCDVIEFEDAL